MKTPTHFAINYLLAERLGWAADKRMVFAIGGVVPDLPIIVTFAVLWGLCVVAGCGTSADVLALFRQLYAENPWLISAHNLLHSPASIALLYLMALALGREESDTARTFLLGAGLHSFIDIYTHVDDGPLMLWPFEWTRRFEGPISHWDTATYALACMAVEAAILALFIGPRLARATGARSCWN